MSDRRSRLSRSWVRAIAWVVGGATFLSVAGAFGAAPKPASSMPSNEAAERRMIVRKIVRRVIVVDAPRAPVTRPVAASVPSSDSSSGSSGPPSPPATSTGGS